MGLSGLICGPFFVCSPLKIGLDRPYLGFVFLDFPFVFNNLLAFFVHSNLSRPRLPSSMVVKAIDYQFSLSYSKGIGKLGDIEAFRPAVSFVDTAHRL